MQLLTKQIESTLPSIDSVEQKTFEELQAMIKFFHPLVPWDWYVFAGDKTSDDFLFYGKIFSPDCPYGEIGYFTLKQLQEIKISFGSAIFKVEREKLFKPCAATKIIPEIRT